MNTYDLKKVRGDLNMVAYQSRFDKFDVSNAYREINKGTQCSKAVDRQIREMLEEISSLHQQKNKLDKLLSDAVSAVDDFKSRQYDARRRAADIAIANESLRIRIFSRDGFACINCSSKSGLSIDHIVPVRRGGGNEDENLQTLCISCNSSKGSKIS